MRRYRAPLPEVVRRHRIRQLNSAINLYLLCLVTIIFDTAMYLVSGEMPWPAWVVLGGLTFWSYVVESA